MFLKMNDTYYYMSNANQYTFTGFLGRTTNYFGKFAFIMFFLAMLVGGILVGLSEPSGSAVDIAEDSSRIVHSFTLNSRQSIYIAYFSEEDDSFLLFELIDKNNQDVIRSESVYSGNVFNIDLSRGTYDIRITNLDSDGKTIKAVTIVANINPLLLVVFIVLILMFAISFAIFWIFFPFYLLILILNGLNSINKPKDLPIKTASVHQSQTQNNAPNQFSQSSTSPKSGKDLTSNPNNIFLDIKLENYIGFLIAIIIYSLIGYEGFFFFVFLVIIFVNVNAIVKRNRIRMRTLRYLQLVGTTNIDNLMLNLGFQKRKRVLDTLRYMAYHLGYPIAFDLSKNTVWKTDDLTPYIPREVSIFREKDKASPTQTSSGKTQSIPTNDVVKTNTKVKDQVKSEIIEFYCPGCGVGLPSNTMYCYNCGQKQ
jgi:hypothetical protein